MELGRECLDAGDAWSAWRRRFGCRIADRQTKFRMSSVGLGQTKAHAVQVARSAARFKAPERKA
jgi:hypothetical protein